MTVSTPQRFDWNFRKEGRRVELVSTPQRFDWNIEEAKGMTKAEMFQPRNGSIGIKRK